MTGAATRREPRGNSAGTCSTRLIECFWCRQSREVWEAVGRRLWDVLSERRRVAAGWWASPRVQGQARDALLRLDFASSNRKRSCQRVCTLTCIRTGWRFSSYLLENNRPALAISCDGDPAPDRLLPDIREFDWSRPATSKPDLLALGKDGSMGELAPDGDADLGWVEYPIGKWSDLEFDIINYLAGVMSQIRI